MSILNIILNPKPGQDPITKILHLAVDQWGLDLDIDFWSAQLSFVFIGYLFHIFTQNQQFIVGIMVFVAVRGMSCLVEYLIEIL